MKTTTILLGSVVSLLGISGCVYREGYDPLIETAMPDYVEPIYGHNNYNKWAAS